MVRGIASRMGNNVCEDIGTAAIRAIRAPGCAGFDVLFLSMGMWHTARRARRTREFCVLSMLYPAMVAHANFGKQGDSSFDGTGQRNPKTK